VSRPTLTLIAHLLPLLLGGCGEKSLTVADYVGVAGAGTTEPSSTTGGGGAGTRDRFMLGADISWVDEEEDLGLTYVDDGVDKELFELLTDHGLNFVRLRLFVDPAQPCRFAEDGAWVCGYQHDQVERAEPYCDLEHTLVMAERAVRAGMGLLINFHMSDTWADPDDQHKPASFEGLTLDELAAAVEAYTTTTLLAFAERGLLPDMVELGNEITPGFLFPEGRSGDQNWPNFARLVKAGITGVRAVSPRVRVMLHLDKPDSYSTTDWWLSNMLAEGVDFDVLGQSCYPEWHGPFAGWKESFEQLALAYPDLDFVVAEYSEEKRATNDLMWSLPDGRGLGTFLWEPTRWGEALFERDGDRRITNDLIKLYDQMSENYGLVP